MKKEPTPSNDKSNSGVCSTYNAECSKVRNMFIVCDHKQKSKRIADKFKSEKKKTKELEQTYRQPIPPREHPKHKKKPLLCDLLSDGYYESESMITAATTYGGTVSI